MGKTLAFLLPVMERIRSCKPNGIGSMVPTPKVLILSPTKELAN
jgi:superfamily II DNA/RNA helicase